jgi:glycosyltransferase involved in cell wall biosynthesis
MTKICIVVHDLRGGGAEKMMVRLANQMALEGDDISIILISSGGENLAFVDDSVTLVELNCHRTLHAFFPLRKMLKALKPDAVLSALTHINVITAFCCASLGWSKKLSVSERNTFSLDKRVNSNRFMRFAYKIAPWVYRFLPNPVICVSKGVADDLVSTTAVRGRDVVIAPNPVITNETKQAAEQPAYHPWLQKKDKPVLVAVGRLSHQKGFDLLIDVFSQLNKQVPSRLIIFGEGELRGSLQSQIDSLGICDDVSLAGYTSNPIAELKSADVYVLSSRFEGSPNALVEAMSVNTPVVAFDCPSGAREILQNGKVGYLVEHLNTDSLLHALIKCLNEHTNATNPPDYAPDVLRFTAQKSAQTYKSLLTRAS